jgi:hypothetical protein
MKRVEEGPIVGTTVGRLQGMRESLCWLRRLSVLKLEL